MGRETVSVSEERTPLKHQKSPSANLYIHWNPRQTGERVTSAVLTPKDLWLWRGLRDWDAGQDSCAVRGPAPWRSWALAALRPQSTEGSTSWVLTTFYGLLHSRIHGEYVLLHQLQWPWPEGDLFVEIICETGSFQLHLSSWDGPLCSGGWGVESGRISPMVLMSVLVLLLLSGFYARTTVLRGALPP